MASSPSPTSAVKLEPAPTAPHQMAQQYAGYQSWLASLPPAELAAEVTRLNALIQQDQQARMTSLLHSVSRSSLDDPVTRSTATATRSPRPSDAMAPVRGAAASDPAPRPASSPLELLLGTARMGPRLAIKLVLAEHRRRAR